MKRRITVNETPELEIVLNDKVYNILFSNSLLMHYTEKYGDINKDMGGALNSCEFFAKLIHCYFEYIGDDVSLSECKVLILKGGDSLIGAITECLIDSISMSDNEEVKKKVLLAKAQMEKLKK